MLIGIGMKKNGSRECSPSLTSGNGIHEWLMNMINIHKITETHISHNITHYIENLYVNIRTEWNKHFITSFNHYFNGFTFFRSDPLHRTDLFLYKRTYQHNYVCACFVHSSERSCRELVWGWVRWLSGSGVSLSSAVQSMVGHHGAWSWHLRPERSSGVSGQLSQVRDTQWWSTVRIDTVNYSGVLLDTYSNLWKQNIKI